jgi:hypothetical protein
MSQNKFSIFVQKNLIATIIVALIIAGGVLALAFSAYNSGAKSVQNNSTISSNSSSSYQSKSSSSSSSSLISLAVLTSSSQEIKKEAVMQTIKEQPIDQTLTPQKNSDILQAPLRSDIISTPDYNTYTQRTDGINVIIDKKDLPRTGADLRDDPTMIQVSNIKVNSLRYGGINPDGNYTTSDDFGNVYLVPPYVYEIAPSKSYYFSGKTLPRPDLGEKIFLVLEGEFK